MTELWPEDRWEPPDPPATAHLDGVQITLCEDPPAELPAARPVGFTADLEVDTHGGEQTHH